MLMQFDTHEGRLALYYQWSTTQPGQHSDDGREAQITSCTDWLRWCIQLGHLDPARRLPAYDELAQLPFGLSVRDIARVVATLRDEGVLPARKTRKDAHTVRWTERDDVCLTYIGHMHALRFDQLGRLLARWSVPARTTLSASTISETLTRWRRLGLASYERDSYRRPGWIWLTRKGMHTLGLPFRAEAPSERTFEHLYWINEVRLCLEETYPTGMQWISERSIQTGAGLRQAGERRRHLPDGLVVFTLSEGDPVEVEVEVQVSKPTPAEVRQVLAAEDGLWTQSSRPLYYYVNRQSRGVVRIVHEQMRDEGKALRHEIQVIDLDAGVALVP